MNAAGALLVLNILQSGVEVMNAAVELQSTVAKANAEGRELTDDELEQYRQKSKAALDLWLGNASG